MAVRPVEVLRQEQAAMIERMRAPSGETSPVSPISERVDAVATLGRITEVVTSDATYGPHLVVQPQVFAGSPAVAGNAEKPTVRAYPTPNSEVSDYSLNEFVLLLTCRGAILAMRLVAS